MNTSVTNMQEQASFTLAVREVISTAQREAVSMNATEVFPEHLFLGVLAQENDEVMEAFRSLKLNQAVLREQVLILFPSHTAVREDESNVPLSIESHMCMEWAMSFATYQHTSSVRPEHVLLGCIRHQRLQPLLALFLMNAGSMLPFSLTERSGQTYTATMDQYIFSRIRQQSVYGIHNKILSSFERPTALFSDIVGFHTVKQELREVTTFLRNPRFIRQDTHAYLYGLLFVGSAGASRTTIVHTIAGEAGVPLLSLSLAVLVEMTYSSSSEHMEDLHVVHSPRELSQERQAMMAERGRHIIHDLFEQGKKVAPCVLHVDELDVLVQPELQNVCGQWQSQLRSELDECDTYMAVVATTRSRQQVDPVLLIPGRFTHIAILDGTVMKPFEADVVLCSACQQEVPTHWKYCGFCGTARARTCPQCGAIQPEVKGVHFCPHCGRDLEER